MANSSAVWSPHVHLDFVVCARHGWRVDDALLDRLGRFSRAGLVGEWMMDDGRVAVHHLRRQAVYARVTFVQINPEDLEGAARDFDESVIPAARQEEGFQGALLLVRDDGTAMAVDLSDTLEHMQANERSGFYQSQVAKFRDRIVGHPRREVYRVAVARGVRGGVELLEEAS